MADVAGFVWAGLAGGGLSATLLAIAAVLGKSQLTHWLNKDIEGIKARHQQDLERAKASYARELEAYRTSLIAQAEAIKASQDVKKAMAVKIAEMKFAAIQSLHEAAAGMGVMLSMIEASRRVGLDVDYGAIAALGGALHGATTKAKPFLLGVHHDRLISFANSYFEDVSKLQRIHGGREMGDSLQIYAELLSQHRECEGIVAGCMNEMLEMA
ncbi:hypothetical protein ACOYR4_06145 [Acidovorax sp. M14]|uniref:hypothetical protein n=1 Tax=Acidovorax sp. M14 TaxID=3411354 RepID=UPI003BF5BEE3